MQKKLILLITCTVFTLFAHKGFGQVNILFLAEVYGRSIDGLGNFQVQNLTGQPLKGQVTISVREDISKTQVVTIVTPAVTINAGNTYFPAGAYAGSAFNFTSSSLAAIISQTRSFPPGEYSYCYRFIPSDKGEDYENCFDASITPIVPISLINPADQDKICQKRPPLSWQPPVPFPASMRFRLQLTEKIKGDAVENLLMHSPLILLDNIPTTTISYPAFAPDLKEGSTYCWQVIAYQNGVILSRSEIWEFTVQCKDALPQDPLDSYRELKFWQNGNYYITSRLLKFSFRNNYNIKKLSYTISDIEKAGEAIKNLPAVTLQNGMNKIDIDLSDLDLVSGKSYLLKVYPFNEPEVTVRFVYQESTIDNP